jgi:hypothetical protein
MATDWTCNDATCGWSGPRELVDGHIRATYHGCSPRPATKACPNCAGQINAGSTYCRLCKTQLVAIQLPPRPY